MPKTLLAARSLRARPVRALLRAICDAADRWRDADFPPRVRVQAAIEQRTGYSLPVIEFALDRLFDSMQHATLAAAIEAEVGSLDALDGPVPQGRGGAAFARGVERVVIVASDTTIGVALVPAIYALAAKSRVLVKDRDDRLTAAFFATLIEEEPAFAGSAETAIWHGGNDPRESMLFAEADTIVVFGNDATIEGVRSGARAGTRVVAFGHRASAGYLRRADVAPFAADLSERIARDALLYDGSGCMSLHVLFVEADDAAATVAVARTIGAALDRVAIEFPPSALAAGRAASHAAVRDLAAFRAASGTGAVIAAPAAQASVIVDPPHDAPPPLAARVLPVITVGSSAEAAAYLHAHELPLEALAVADTGAFADVSAVAFAGGAVRIARFGEMQSPSAASHHGGEPCILPYVRWIDVER